MRFARFDQFQGVNRRLPPRVADPRTLFVGTNVELTTGQALKRRPGRRQIATLSPESVGLYTVDGQLRAVRPSTGAPLERVASGETAVFYDYVGTGFFGETPATMTAAPEAVSSSFVMGARPGFGSRPYLVLRFPGAREGIFRYEHHLIDRVPPLTGGPAATRVRLPFEPGAAAIRAYGKVWAEDRSNNAVRFSSALNGPTDWVAPRDAGALNVSQHAQGDDRLRALASYSDMYLAVMFQESTQLWRLDPDPRNVILADTFNGPGTRDRRSVVSALGDLLFLSQGGFRSLHTTDVSERVRPRDDIGSAIEDLTKDETGQATAALWSQGRAQFLCAFGSRIYVLTYLPDSQVMGWSVWNLDEPVDYMVELNGVLYYRSGNNLFRFDDDHDDACVFSVIPNAWYTEFNRRHAFLHFTMEGKARIDFTVDGREIPGFTYVGSPGGPKIPLGLIGREFAPRFSGNGPWHLTSWSVEYQQLSR